MAASDPNRNDARGGTPKLTVIIVNYNGGAVIERCLTALECQTYRDFSTIVVDNASSDGSPEHIASRFPGVRLVRAERNLGFAGGNNLAFSRCPDSDWIALLNPDAYPRADWLAALMAAAGREPGHACFAGLLLAEDERHVDGIGDACHFSGLCFRLGHGRSPEDLDLEQREIFSVCAAAALYRASAVCAAGGFDEDFFCYCEDVDLGFRLRLAGHRALFVPDAVVVHSGSGIIGVKSDFQVYHGHRNLVWMYVKNMPGMLFWLLLPVHILLNLVSLVWFALRGQGEIILRAKRDALRGLPGMWAKRKMIQVQRTATITDIWRTLDKRLWP